MAETSTYSNSSDSSYESEKQKRKCKRRKKNASDESSGKERRSRKPQLSVDQIKKEPNENSENNSIPQNTNTNPFVNSEGSSSRVNGAATDRDLLHQLLLSIEEMRAELRQVNQKVDLLLGQTFSPFESPVVTSLPPDLQLPLSTVQELEVFNERLKNDPSLTTILANHFYNAASGKTASAFLTSIVKKILTAELASQFSRLGRKGKKSFEPYVETLNVIIAASAKKFLNTEREKLLELFGRSLACSGDWNGRKPKSLSLPLQIELDY